MINDGEISSDDSDKEDSDYSDREGSDEENSNEGSYFKRALHQILLIFEK